MPTLEELKAKAVESGIEVEDTMSEEDIQALIDKKEEDTKNTETPTIEDLISKVEYLESESKRAFDSRDRAKEERNRLKLELEAAKSGSIDAPNKAEIDKLAEELRVFKEQEDERKDKQEEEDLKKLSELERQKRLFDKELDKVKLTFDEKVQEALNLSKEAKEELKKKDDIIVSLTHKTLEGEIARIAGENEAWKPFQIVRLLKDEFEFNDTLGQFIYEKKNDKGKIIDDMTVSERVKEFLQDPENENLLKAKGSTGGMETRQSTEKTTGSLQGKRHGYDPKDAALLKEADEKGLDVDFLIDTKIMQDKKLKRGSFAPTTE